MAKASDKIIKKVELESFGELQCGKLLNHLVITSLHTNGYDGDSKPIKRIS